MRPFYPTEEAICFSAAMARGGAIHVRNIVEGLRDRGYDVTLLDWNSAPEREFQHSIALRMCTPVRWSNTMPDAADMCSSL